MQMVGLIVGGTALVLVVGVWLVGGFIRVGRAGDEW